MEKYKKQSGPLVTYIRVREIFHSFLEYKYGSSPIDLPEVSKLYGILSTNLVPNYSMYRMNYSSFSQAAYNTSLGGENVCPDIITQGTRSIYLPTEEDRKKLIPFVIPASVIIGRKVIATDQWFQMTNGGYREMSKTIETEFWNKFVEFDQKFNLYCYRNGSKYNQEISIEKFMMLIGMDMKFEDVFARYWRKKKESDSKLFSSYSNKESTDELKSLMGDL